LCSLKPSSPNSFSMVTIMLGLPHRKTWVSSGEARNFEDSSLPYVLDVSSLASPLCRLFLGSTDRRKIGEIGTHTVEGQ